MLLIVARPSVVENSMGLSLARAPPSRGLCFRLRTEPTLALHHLGDAEIGGDKILGRADAGAMPGQPDGIDAGSLGPALVDPRYVARTDAAVDRATLADGPEQRALGRRGVDPDPANLAFSQAQTVPKKTRPNLDLRRRPN